LQKTSVVFCCEESVVASHCDAIFTEIAKVTLASRASDYEPCAENIWIDKIQV
jgi:hypothetical protein